MPKDKTATHQKLCECMRREFLEKGFEKASLNNIAKQVGITPAAVYRHYLSKEAMFEALVKPVVDDFNNVFNEYMKDMTEDDIKGHVSNGYSTFEDGFLDYIYDHFEEIKLLMVCSKGTKYESFFDTLVRTEEESSMHMIKMLKKSGYECAELTAEQHHIAATMYMTGLYEIIRHDMPREKAVECIQFIYDFYNSAWRAVLNLK